LAIGGFEAFHAILQMAEAREKFPEFRIPMTVMPATISNNVPGTMDSGFGFGYKTFTKRFLI